MRDMTNTNLNIKQSEEIKISDQDALIEAIRYSKLYKETSEEYLKLIKANPNDYLKTGLTIQILQNHNMLIQQIFTWLIAIKNWILKVKTGKQVSLLNIIFDKEEEIYVNPSKVKEIEKDFNKNNNNFILDNFVIEQKLNNKDLNYLADSFKILLSYVSSQLVKGQVDDKPLYDKLHHIFNKTKHGCLVQTIETNGRHKLIIIEKILSSSVDSVTINPFSIYLQDIKILTYHIKSMEIISNQFIKILAFHFKNRFGEDSIPNWLKTRLDAMPEIEKYVFDHL